MQLAATLVTNLQQLQTWQSRWQSLTDSLDGTVDFFASYAYTYAYLNHYPAPDWFVVVIHDQHSGQLQAAFPLQRFHITHGAEQFTACKALGVPYLPYIDFAIRSQSRREVITFLLNDVLRAQLHNDLVFFWPLHEDSKLYLTLLEDLGTHPALKVDRYPRNLHSLDTRGLSFAAFIKTRSSDTFKNAAYHLRRLHRKGDVCFSTPTDPDELRVAVRQLCERNQARHGSKHAYGRFPDWPDFIVNLTTQLVPQGRAEVTTLALDGETIASRLCFLHKGRRIFYMIDYDDAFREFSVGKILMRHQIVKTFEEGGIFCMGAGDFAYKRDWASNVGEIKSAIVFLNSEAREVLEQHLNKAGISRMCAF